MKWNSSADDWEQILSGNNNTPSEGQAPKVTSDGGVAIESNTTNSNSPAGIVLPSSPTDTNPISEAVLEEMNQVFPPVWRSDQDLETIIQQVVFSFLTETNTANQTPSRAKASIKKAAKNSDLPVSQIVMLCTKTLYRGESKTPSKQLCRDLETLENRLNLD